MAGFLVFLASFAVYGWTASAAVGWLDSPEFVAAAATLGVPHSPGHPTAPLLGYLAGLVPLGDWPLRVNLVSALAGAGAATCAWAAGRHLLRLVDEELPPRLASAAAAAAALVFAFAWASWMQAVRAEVYALEMLLLAGALAAILAYERDPRPRHVYLAALLLGLALSTHHLIAVLFFVPAAAFVLVRHRNARPSARTAGLAASVGILGLASFAYLPLRSLASPLVNWAAPHTLERFIWTVSGRAFHQAAGGEHVSSPGQDALQVVATLLDEGTVVVGILALVGAAAGLATPRWRRAALLLLGIAAVGGAGRVLVGFDPGTPDHHGYLTPALLGVVLLGLAGTASLARAARQAGARERASAVGLVAVMAVIAAAQLARIGPEASQRGADGSDTFLHWELAAAPPRALLLPSYFQTSFRLWAAQAVFGARPDVAVLDRSFLTYPGMAAQARERHPELASLIDAPLRAGEPTPIARLGEVAAQRPILVQLHINLEDEVHPHLLPHGAWAIFWPRPVPERARAAIEPRDRAERARLARALGDASGDRTGADEALLWHDFVRVRFYCSLGRRAAAAQVLADARTIAPDDLMLGELAAACGLE